MKKPKLSFWQIWNLSFGFLGVQIGYSLQNSNTSSIFESLGADVSHLSYFWLAAPVAGMIIQPLVGLFSDGTWTRLGRRVPYILGGAVVSTVALALMPNSPTLLTFAPLVVGALILLFMDLSFNVTMQPFRALVADMLDDSQKTQGYVVQTFLINLGAVVGAVLPLLMTLCGVSDEAPAGQVPDHIAYSYYIGGAILLLTVLVTACRAREYPPEEFARYNAIAEPAAERPGFAALLRNVPPAMLRLGVTQFFSWAARWGNRPVYVVTLLCGAAGFAGLWMLRDQYALMVPMIGIGIAWAGILAMPYAILSLAVEPRHMGVYMGIFNFTVVIPQIVIGLTGGAIVTLCFAGDARSMLLLAAVFMLLAALSAVWTAKSPAAKSEAQ